MKKSLSAIIAKLQELEDWIDELLDRVVALEESNTGGIDAIGFDIGDSEYEIAEDSPEFDVGDEDREPEIWVGDIKPQQAQAPSAGGSGAIC